MNQKIKSITEFIAIAGSKKMYLMVGKNLFLNVTKESLYELENDIIKYAEQSFSAEIHLEGNTCIFLIIHNLSK